MDSVEGSIRYLGKRTMGSGIDKIVAVVRATPERSVRTAWYISTGVGLLFRRMVVYDVFDNHFKVLDCDPASGFAK